jgi:hypothetical protein
MGDYEPPEKKQRMESAGRNSIILLIPSHLMPGLVGKGGNSVRQLEQASGARILCEKVDRGEDRGVEVSGSSISIGEAVRHIADMVKNSLALTVTTMKIAVTATIAPKLVGKQGNCIKQMIASSGANIVIERASDMGPSYSDSSRTVTISGTTDSVTAAVILIVEKIDDLERNSGPSRRPERDFDRRERPSNYGYDAGPGRDWYGPPADLTMERSWPMGGGGGGGGGIDPYDAFSFAPPRSSYGYDESRGGDFRGGGGGGGGGDYFPSPAHRDPPPHYAPPRHAAPQNTGAGRETTLTIRVPAKFAGQVRPSPALS